MSNSEIIETFLKEYSKESTKRGYKRHVEKFLEWVKKSPSELIKEYKDTQDKNEWKKKFGRLVVEYNNYLLEHGGKNGKPLKPNSVRTNINAVRAFFSSTMDSVKIPRGRITQVEMATGEHEYKQSQLQKMFRVGNIREKAILSLGVCLGFGATAFSELKRDYLEKIMSQTESEQTPIGFWHIRTKTSQPIRCHLTTEAINALRDYWGSLKEKSEWAFPSNGFHISQDGLNYVLKSLTEKANIPTMGKVRWHLLRKFLFSALTNTMDEMNAKLCVGKSIDKSVLTYLKNKSDILKKQYDEAEKFFVLSGYTNHEYNRMDMMEEKIKTQDETLQKFLDIFTQYVENKINKDEIKTAIKVLRETQKHKIQLPKIEGETGTQQVIREIEQLPKIRDKQTLEKQLGYILTKKQFQIIKNAEEYLGKKLTLQNIKSLLKTNNR